MKTIGILMKLKYDISGKKVVNLSPIGGEISLPDNCVICYEQSSGEAPLLTKIKVAEIGDKYELKQVMPYCQKHLNRLSHIRLLNIIPILITLWIAFYLFNALGGFSGPGGISIIIQGFFLASIAGMVTQAFVRGVIIKSFQTGTSGTGVKIQTIMQTEKNLQKSLLVNFGFQNEIFATQFEQINPPEIYNPPVKELIIKTDQLSVKEINPLYESINKETEPDLNLIQTQNTDLLNKQAVSDNNSFPSSDHTVETESIDDVIRQRRLAVEEKNKQLFQKKG